jgi:hypothetical protein
VTSWLRGLTLGLVLRSDGVPVLGDLTKKMDEIIRRETPENPRQPETKLGATHGGARHPPGEAWRGATRELFHGILERSLGDATVLMLLQTGFDSLEV